MRLADCTEDVAHSPGDTSMLPRSDRRHVVRSSIGRAPRQSCWLSGHVDKFEAELLTMLCFVGVGAGKVCGLGTCTCPKVAVIGGT